MTGLVDEGRRVSKICLDFSKTLEAASQHHPGLMKCGLQDWTVRCTEIQLNISAHSFVKSGMIFKKKKEVPSPAHGVEQPQPPVQTRGS